MNFLNYSIITRMFNFVKYERIRISGKSMIPRVDTVRKRKRSGDLNEHKKGNGFLERKKQSGKKSLRSYMIAEHLL